MHRLCLHEMAHVHNLQRQSSAFVLLSKVVAVRGLQREQLLALLALWYEFFGQGEQGARPSPTVEKCPGWQGSVGGQKKNKAKSIVMKKSQPGVE